MAKKRGARRRWRQFLFSTRSQQKIVCQEHVQSSLSPARRRNFTIIDSDNWSINMFIFLTDYKNRPGTLYLEIGDGTRKKSRSHLVCGDTFRSTKSPPSAWKVNMATTSLKKWGGGWRAYLSIRQSWIQLLYRLLFFCRVSFPSFFAKGGWGRPFFRDPSSFIYQPRRPRIREGGNSGDDWRGNFLYLLIQTDGLAERCSPFAVEILLMIPPFVCMQKTTSYWDDKAEEKREKNGEGEKGTNRKHRWAF